MPENRTDGYAPALRYASALRTGQGAAVTTTKITKRGLQTSGMALFASALVTQLAAAQVSIDVSACVDLTTPEERLACFEAQVEAAGDASAEAAPAATGAPARSAPPEAAPAATGAPAAASRDRDEDNDAPPPDIIAKVAELRETVPNSSLITLDNGQVWRQTVPENYPLRPGSDVRIYYSRWNAYRLTSPALRGFIQVERVR